MAYSRKKHQTRSFRKRTTKRRSRRNRRQHGRGTSSSSLMDTPYPPAFDPPPPPEYWGNVTIDMKDADRLANEMMASQPNTYRNKGEALAEAQEIIKQNAREYHAFNNPEFQQILDDQVSAGAIPPPSVNRRAYKEGRNKLADSYIKTKKINR